MNILQVLCAERVKVASKRCHREWLPKSQRGTPYQHQDEIIGLFPGRSSWTRLRREQRAGLDSAEVTRQSLYLTTTDRRSRRHDEDREWIERQDRLIETVRTNLDKGIAGKPRMSTIPKKGKPGEPRDIAVYGLADKLTHQIVARRMQRTFEPLFLNSSYAGRSRRPDGSVPSHHDAMQSIIDWRNKNAGENGRIRAWIAEIDIRGFFDTLDHDVILRCYDLAVDALGKQHGVAADAMLRIFLLSFLASYDYLSTGRPEALKEMKRRGVRGTIWNPRRAVNALHEGRKATVGVPQGSPISQVLANIVLHWADKAVVEAIRKYPAGSVRYYRFCDDVLIVAKTGAACRAAFAAYEGTLGELKLRMHLPTATRRYGRDFWSGKTRRPYRWGARRPDGAVPWLSFVGYQLRYDGQIRVRKSSLANERDTVRQHVRAFIERSRPVVGRRSTLLRRLDAHLQAHAVGRKARAVGDGSPKHGWIAGFPLLSSPDHRDRQWLAEGQLRDLDRYRRRALGVARRALGVPTNGGCRVKRKGSYTELVRRKRRE